MKNYPTWNSIAMGSNLWWARKLSLLEPIIIYPKNAFKRTGILLKELGIVDSVSQARRNDWDIEIPYGFSEFKFGQHRIDILNTNMGKWELFHLQYIDWWLERLIKY